MPFRPDLIAIWDTTMSELHSQGRWQWAAIALLAAGLIYVGLQGLGAASRGMDAVQGLANLQGQLEATISQQHETARRLGQVVEQIDTAVQGGEEARSALNTLQQGVDDRLETLQSRLEPVVSGQESAARRLGQLEEQVFAAVTRQQAAAKRVTELGGQINSVARELEEARLELGALRDEMAALVAAALTSAAVELSDTWTNDLQMTFVLVPAGSFEMGSELGDEDEQPVRSVAISEPYYMGQFEVTQAQWFSLMESDPSQFSDDDNRPVENVSWQDAQAFIAKLNASDPAAVYRLPTEAEWEYAARAGSAAAYAFGDDVAELDAHGWHSGNAENTTHPVGEKEPNAWGLHAMHGGVWEWVQDRYGPYPSDLDGGAPETPPGIRRVLRGGSWLSPPEDCRSASRSHAHPTFRGANVGFRIVRTIP